MSNKNPIAYVTTPIGEFEWVVIEGEGKEMLNGENKYVASIVLEGDKADDLKSQILAFWEENKPKNFKKSYTNEADKGQDKIFEGDTRDGKSFGIYAHREYVLDEDGNVKEDENGEKEFRFTGKTVFTFTTSMEYGDGKPKTVDVFNKNGTKVNLGGKKVGNGSRGRINGSMGIYTVFNPAGKKILDAGVALYLNALQIGKLVEYTAGANFDAMEDDEADFEGVGEMGAIDESDETTQSSDDKPEV